jgi:sulfur carrier protein
LKVLVNGMETEVPSRATLYTLLRTTEEPHGPDMIVEVNRRFIHLEAYDSTYLEEGDSIEIIHLAMGG